MNIKFKYCFILLALFSCSKINEKNNQPISNFPTPKVVKLNTTEGYAINQFNNDSIKPLITAKGDTVISGKPIELVGYTFSPKHEENPKNKLFLPSTQKTTAYPFKKELSKIKISSTVKIETVSISLPQNKTNNDTSHYILNSVGDTVKTGIPISINGKSVRAKKAKTLKSLPPRFKDNAKVNIQYWDVDQGLPSSYLRQIVEDEKGYLWFGTWGAGLCRFDGHSYKQFTNEEGLSHNTIRTIMIDKSKSIWIGTNGGGLNLFDGKKFTHFTEKEGFIDDDIVCTLEDRNGNIWIGTYDHGLAKYDGNTFTFLTEKEGLIDNNISSILEDKNGNIWIGTHKGVCYFDGKTFNYITDDKAITNHFIKSILEDSWGYIWFGTQKNGVIRYNTTDRKLSHITESEGLSNNAIWSLLQDNQGNIWLGTNGGGISKCVLSEKGQISSFFYINDQIGLNHQSVIALSQDKSGNIWIGTNGGGLSKYNPNSFVHFTEKEGLSGSAIVNIHEDSKGRIWFASYGKGVDYLENDTMFNINKNSGLKDNSIWTILEDRNENLWFGSFGEGINKFDGEYFTHFSVKNGLSYNSIWSIIEDRKGTLWFATNGGGISNYDGQNFVHFSENEGLSNNLFTSLLEDKKGNLWFGSYGGGVSKFDGVNVIHFTEKEGLSSNLILSILEDSKGNYWFGTWGGGINIYTPPTKNKDGFITYITEKEGLTNNIVMSLVEDDSGNIWAGTEKGLCRFNFIDKRNRTENRIDTTLPRSTEQQIIVKRYLKSDGLKGMNIFSNLIDHKNQLWLGSGKNLSMLDLNSYQSSQNPPTVCLNQLEVNNLPIDFLNPSNNSIGEISYKDVEAFENYPLNLELSFDNNHLTFNFIGIDWKAPHKIKYSYIVEGLNEHWSTPSKETKADYRNLPYGSYTFKLKAIGESGQWSKAIEYPFVIYPPWWHTWWARTTYGLMAILIVFGYTRLRTRKLKQRQKELEIEIDSATKEIREQKEKIEESHKEITDSIQYAKRIQSAILPPQKEIDQYLPNSFIIYKPKDIVAGDFYWLEKMNNKILFAAADCTGHGVPGAMVSVVCHNGLNRSVREYGLTTPGQILDKTREIVISEFEKSEEEVKDGMDIALCSIENETLEYAGANNPLWIIRDNNLIETKADKQPIGKFEILNPYTTHQFKLQKNDCIYIFSDGYADQFGGEKNKKFKTANLKKLLLSIQNMPIKEQGAAVESAFEKWKGDQEQLDDVCIIGIKV